MFGKSYSWELFLVNVSSSGDYTENTSEVRGPPCKLMHWAVLVGTTSSWGWAGQPGRAHPERGHELLEYLVWWSYKEVALGLSATKSPVLPASCSGLGDFCPHGEEERGNSNISCSLQSLLRLLPFTVLFVCILYRNYLVFTLYVSYPCICCCVSVFLVPVVLGSCNKSANQMEILMFPLNCCLSKAVAAVANIHIQIHFACF